MSLEELFLGNLRNWKKHCESSDDYLDCDAYYNLVIYGSEMLPFVKKYSDEVPEGFLGKLVSDIIGDFEIPEEIRGKVSEIEKYTAKWLEENVE